jgi:serine/threonine protein kinase
MLARRKAQRLASKLQEVYREKVGPRPEIPVRAIVPWVHEAVFLHHPETRVALPESSRISLFGLDELESTSSGLPGISQLIHSTSGRGSLIHPQQEEMLTLLLSQIGLVQRREREVGSWVIVDGGAIAEGDGWQDWEASGKETGAPARIRFQTHVTDVERQIARAVADHEFATMRRLHHDGLIRPIDVVNDDQLGRGIVYDWDPNLERLDHWLDDHGPEADLSQRLHILREVGEVLDYAHSKGLAHRALSPQTIWIGPPSAPGGELAVKVSDWSASGSTQESGSALAGITEYAAQASTADEAALHAFQAPEGVWSASATDRLALDQFSLGAVTYYLVAEEVPAATRQELVVRLREQHGLDLGVNLPEIPEQIREAVRTATDPSPSKRHPSIRQVLACLDVPSPVVSDKAVDPREAGANDVLGEGRFTVKKRLGKGSTALGLLVEDSELTTVNRDRVLKVALDEKAQARLIDEANVLSRVRSRRVVNLISGPIDLGATTALLLESAGEDTLRDVLRQSDNGIPVDLLERYGDDLLEAIEVLDKAGIDHRDIKPANLGVGRDSSKIWHVKLFDFSLSKASASEIAAGTAPYLDPFLGNPSRGLYDSAAERYSVAVVLYEMATGKHPVYGDDARVNPAAITDDVTINPKDFPEGLREDLTDFFTRSTKRSRRPSAWTGGSRKAPCPRTNTARDNSNGPLPLFEISPTTAPGPRARSSMCSRAPTNRRLPPPSTTSPPASSTNGVRAIAGSRQTLHHSLVARNFHQRTSTISRMCSATSAFHWPPRLAPMAEVSS